MGLGTARFWPRFDAQPVPRSTGKATSTTGTTRTISANDRHQSQGNNTWQTDVPQISYDVARFLHLIPPVCLRSGNGAFPYPP